MYCQEKWIPGYEHKYMITSEGEIYSYVRGYRKLLKSFTHRTGYVMINLSLEIKS